MADLNKVIKGIECCLDHYEPMCEKCPYMATEEDRSHVDWDCHKDQLAFDALKILKEQETELCDRCGRIRLKSSMEER